ncbi:pilus assembly protein [Xenophilus sp.]|uniref:pilus assembly protein n=1 Tax=Xenophilus sp. TaxID=1873499 RepID=UPI0037DC02C3
MKKQRRIHPASSLRRRPAALAAAAALGLPAAVLAAPLALSTAPAGTGYKPPAPNVIISVDDSGSMGDSGMATLRAALQDTFSPANVPDGTIRLGWQSMTGCFTIPSGGDCANQNGIRVLDSTQRTRFMTWVDTLRPQGTTPSHRMLFNAGQYYRQPPSVDSPWASIPGQRQEPMLSCRRAYTVFMTDGGWNSTGGWGNSNTSAANAIGNADGTSRTLGDGSTLYDTGSDQTRIYRDSFGSTNLPTLADLAFHFWATDLQPGLNNDVSPKKVIDDVRTVTVGSSSVALQPKWNPRNNPATWQHMTTYTVGFNAAANWNGTVARPLFGTDTWTGSSYDELVLGLQLWTDPINTPNQAETRRMPELWHMALNSRGKFIPAPTAADLAPAFREILDHIVRDDTKPVTSLAVGSHSTRVAGSAFAASYDGSNWTGGVTAHAIAAGTGQVSSTGAWGTVPANGSQPAKPKSTATIMDETSFSPTDRVVLSASTTVATGGTTATTQGISWTWSQLSAAQQAELNLATPGATPDALGEQRVAYIRGDHSQEQNQTPAGPFRTRASRHGDIVNSDVWFTAGKPDAGYTTNDYATFAANNATRRPMIYVGANDGMLHGFDARLDTTNGGKELIAYIPEGLNAALPELSRPGYAHRYYVDGSPFTADAYIGGAWKTYLAGFPGLGGRGYFVLDVTDPGNFSAANAASLVVLDKTAAATLDEDVGHITGRPVTNQVTPSRATQVARMNNGRWALVMGNGYNSASEKAVLLVQYLDGDKELLKLTADNTAGGGNGLAPPQLVDLNGDRIPDVAYAGDLKGRLWKFDLSHASAANWSVAFGGNPLFTAKDASGAAQPITTAPAWLLHPNGGLMLTFGTGRELTSGDRTDTQRQTLYGVWDSTKYTFGTTTNTATSSTTISFADGNNAVAGRSALVQQSVSAGSTATTAGNETKLWTVSSNPVPYSGTDAKKGWYLDLPETAERSLDTASWLSGRLFTFPTKVPATGNQNPDEETCTPPVSNGKNFLTTINVLNGAAPSYAVYAYASAPSTGNPSRAEDPSGGASTAIKKGGEDGGSKCIAGPGVRCDDLKAGAFTSLRATWRQAR